MKKTGVNVKTKVAKKKPVSTKVKEKAIKPKAAKAPRKAKATAAAKEPDIQILKLLDSVEYVREKYALNPKAIRIMAKLINTDNQPLFLSDFARPSWAGVMGTKFDKRLFKFNMTAREPGSSIVYSSVQLSAFGLKAAAKFKEAVPAISPASGGSPE